MLADWVAQNRMASLDALQQWPDFGETSGKEEQAGMQFSWKIRVTSTQNPLFRKIDISVYDAGGNSLRQLSGYLMRPMP